MTGFRNNHLAALAMSDLETRDFWEWSLDPDGETTVLEEVQRSGSVAAITFQAPWSKRDIVDPGQWHELDPAHRGHEWKGIADFLPWNSRNFL